MDINAEKDAVVKKGSEIWAKFRYYIIGGVALILLIIGLVYLGQWYASGQANALAEKLRTQFRQENQKLYDNVATLRDRTQQLESNFGTQKVEIAVIKNNQRGATKNVFQSGDKKAIASLFDNTIDGYVPSK